MVRRSCTSRATKTAALQLEAAGREGTGALARTVRGS